MISKITLHRFKQFKDAPIELGAGVTFVVGANNSGKSSLLHALAVWQFCKTIVEIEKGSGVFVAGVTTQGVGLGDDEFTPISVPSLRHLWTNLRTQKITEADGFTLKIKVQWTKDHEDDRHLEFGLALANDRLFIKVTDSNLGADDRIPQIAYLPPFAGITDKETRLTPAMRNRLVGQGLSGGIIRNVLFDMYQRNQTERSRLRGTRTKLTSSELNSLRTTDSWELLLQTIQDVFQRGLDISPFNEMYHSYIRVGTFRGEVLNKRFQKVAGYNTRDLMVEGSGFLQWLSVYALALSPDFDVVLLDEPDAHLHCSLQTDLISRLETIADSKTKQILLATHSTEIIRHAQPANVMEVSKGTAGYLTTEGQKVKVLAGIGAEYAPRLHKLQKFRRLLVVEGEIDERLLRIWADRLRITWPANVVIWPWSAGHKERKQLISQLRVEIPDLKAISLRDRDDESDGSVQADLVDKSHTDSLPGVQLLKWRRRHIENYLLCPSAIARAAGVEIDVVNSFFADKHALSLPVDTTLTQIAPAIRDARGKEIFNEGQQAISSYFKVSRENVAKAMLTEEVPQDVRTVLERLAEMAQTAGT